MNRRPRFSTRGIVLAYALVAGTWIAFSDRVATALAPNEEAFATISTFKGWGFVAATSALLAGLLYGFGAERASRTRALEAQVAERERAEAHLERLNRVLRMLGLANQALVRAVEETDLLHAFCDVIVEQGAYLGAWVGAREDDEAATIRPVAWAGPLERYLAAIALSWRDPARGSLGPAGTAIREGRSVVVHDVDADTTLAWRDAMLVGGLRSVAALPLAVDAVTVGTLVIYAGDPDSFGPDEIGLLEELATDLAYGVGALRARAAASRGETERRRLATAVEQSAEAVVITDAAGAIEYVNPAFERSSGYTRDEVVGKNPRILNSGVQGPAFYAAMWTALTSGQSFVGDITNRRKDGGLYQDEIVISPIHDDAGAITSYVAANRDVTRERFSEEARQRQARERAQIAGILAELKVLRTPAATAEAICRQVVSLSGATSATIAYFTLDGPAMPLAYVRTDGVPVPLRRLPFQRSRRLRERAEEGPWVEAWVHRPWHPYARQEAEIHTRALAYAPVRHGGTLIGILMVTSAEADAVAQLTERLPALLEFAGFAGALVGPAIGNLTEVHEVHERIADIVKTSAFRPVFQPIIDLATGAHAGYEALTRFASGTSPDLVFADARAAGLETDLEIATLGAAISAAANLPAGAWLSLNVSPGLVTGSGGLSRLLQKADRPIVIEVTEHVPVADYPALRAAIGRLRPEVRVAVDDAGAGVANFGHIVELRPAFVKLDIGLVRGIDADLSRQALMVGLLHFATESASTTIAEGVETDAELSTLRKLGVPFAQGFLLGRPAAAIEWAESATGE